MRRYGLLDSAPDVSFDRITGLAARVFSVPVSIISLVDTDRIWFKSHHGLELTEVTRDLGLCASAILQDEPWIIEDARNDPRAAENPLVAGEFGLQFYAGVPLRTADGQGIGTLCVLGFEPRTVSDDELETLRDLADVVMRELELHWEAKTLGSPGAVTDPPDDARDDAPLVDAPLVPGSLEHLTDGPDENPDGSLITNSPVGTPRDGAPDDRDSDDRNPDDRDSDDRGTDETGTPTDPIVLDPAAAG